MNSITKAVLQSVLSTDNDLTDSEGDALHRVLSGRSESPEEQKSNQLLTEKEAAYVLGVDKATLWRITRDRYMYPFRIAQGAWRFRYAELEAFADVGIQTSHGGWDNLRKQRVRGKGE